MCLYLHVIATRDWEPILLFWFMTPTFVIKDVQRNVLNNFRGICSNSDFKRFIENFLMFLQVWLFLSGLMFYLSIRIAKCNIAPLNILTGLPEEAIETHSKRGRIRREFRERLSYTLYYNKCNTKLFSINRTWKHFCIFSFGTNLFTVANL